MNWPSHQRLRPASRLTQMGTTTYAYDASGNRTSRMAGGDPSTGSGQAATYAWSSGNELTGVTHTPSGDSATYRYDALGRRIQRVHTVAGSGTTTDEFVYDGLDLLAMNRGGAVYQQYVHGPGIDQPLALLDYSGGSLAVYYYHSDRLGSIRALTDATQTVVQSYTYTAFGITTVGTPGGLDQPFRYTAREWDDAAGLYYYRARWYDPDAGRFVSPDPIGFAGGDTNLYAYVENNACTLTDPLGTMAENPTILWRIRYLIFGGIKGARMLTPWGLAYVALNILLVQLWRNEHFRRVVGPYVGAVIDWSVDNLLGPVSRFLFDVVGSGLFAGLMSVLDWIDVTIYNSNENPGNMWPTIARSGHQRGNDLRQYQERMRQSGAEAIDRMFGSPPSAGMGAGTSSVGSGQGSQGCG